MVVVVFLLFRLVPHYYKLTANAEKFESLFSSGFKNGYFSQFIGEMDQFSKVPINITHRSSSP
jgi:hypothetical protein